MMDDILFSFASIDLLNSSFDLHILHQTPGPNVRYSEQRRLPGSPVGHLKFLRGPLLAHETEFGLGCLTAFALFDTIWRE